MARDSQATMPSKIVLSAVRAGTVVRVHEMQGGHTFVSRLASLGFTPGASLKVIQNYRHGPLIVAVRNTRVALGRGEAGRIVVEPLDGADNGHSW